MSAATLETISIRRLGHLGDGIADTPTGKVFTPLTLPGERVEIEREGDRGRLRRIFEASPARTAPVCKHFGVCGGCAVQHMKQGAYLAWKRDLVRVPLAQRGIETDVDPVVPIALGSRRRAVFAARSAGRKTLFGYHARLSHRIVEIEECPILRPEIADALADFAAFAAELSPLKDEVRVGVTVTDTGLDVALEGPRLRPTAMVAFAAPKLAAKGIARLSVAGEPVLRHAEPTIKVDGVEVALPPLVFLQAAAVAEGVMGRLVREGIGGASRVADLYAGVGTFALRMAKSANVMAVDGDAAALRALGRAAKQARGLKAVVVVRRDLAHMPMSASELAEFDAVVFDPPRAGAAEQSAEIAASRVPKVVAVSCNPGTLARDLKTLVDGGYRIDKVTPVDQFLYSPHIEAVAQLTYAG